MKDIEMLNKQIDFSKDGVIEREKALIAMEQQSIGFAKWLLNNTYITDDDCYCIYLRTGVKKSVEDLYKLYNESK